MATLRDIARYIAASNDFKSGDAEAFATAIVDTILAGLAKDKQVKIKGFGTFKLTLVKERESVNVNTGERVTITKHAKITFTPETAVRDLVNKPFAQFDTVVLSELVDLDAMADLGEAVDDNETPEELDTPQVQDLPVMQALASVQEAPTPPQEDVPLPKPQVEPQIEPQIEPQVTNAATIQPSEDAEETIKETQDETQMTSNDNEIYMEDEDTAQSKKKLIIYAVIINIITVAIAFIAGYMLGTKHYFCNDTATTAVEQTASVAPKKQTAAVKEVKADSVATPAPDSIPQPKETAQASAQDDAPSKYYDDARVRTGAYDIIGVDKTVTVQSGQTLKSISKAYLGPDMECYIEALNGVTEVSAGDEVKIPKLKLRKKKKQ